MGTTPPVQLPPPTETATVTPTDTPSPTPTPTPEPEATDTPTPTPEPTPTDTPTPTPTDTPSPTPTDTPTPTPTIDHDTCVEYNRGGHSCETPTPTPDHDTCVDYRGGHSCEPTDKDNPDTGAGSRSVSPPVIPPNDIVICIERAHGTPATVSEGRGLPLQFQLLASRAPTEDLTVNVDVRTTGGTYIDTAPTTVEIVANNQSAMFPVTIDDDERDEQDTTLHAFVDPGDGYEVGTPSQADVRLEDDDKPPKPIHFRVNGHLSGGNITLRWNNDRRSTAFDVRWAREVCFGGAGSGCSHGAWTLEENIATVPSPVTGFRQGLLDGLAARGDYRLQVRAKQVDASDWSDYVVVYPTIAPPHTEFRAVTTVLETWRERGRYSFRVCTPTAEGENASNPDMLPEGVTATQIANAVPIWEDSVRWQKPNGHNIIDTTYLGTSTACVDPLEDESFDQIVFYEDDHFRRLCGVMPNDQSPGCMRFSLWGQSVAQQFTSVVLRLDFLGLEVDWTEVSMGCTRIVRITRHEVGHALGLGHGYPSTMLMYSPDPGVGDDKVTACAPTPHDVGAMMGNYQSRVDSSGPLSDTTKTLPEQR